MQKKVIFFSDMSDGRDKRCEEDGERRMVFACKGQTSFIEDKCYL